MTLRDSQHNLTSMETDFTPLQPFDEHYQHVRFTGNFCAEELIWDAHVYTLNYYLRKVKKLATSRLNCRAFLEVGEINEHGRKIEIGLHLPYLDVPSLKKTMIMVRQYKRLVLGRYEYGETILI